MSMTKLGFDKMVKAEIRHLQASGKPSTYWDACRSLAKRPRRRNRSQRSPRIADLTLPDPAITGRNCLPPGDRE